MLSFFLLPCYILSRLCISNKCFLFFLSRATFYLAFVCLKNAFFFSSPVLRFISSLYTIFCPSRRRYNIGVQIYILINLHFLFNLLHQFCEDSSMWLCFVLRHMYCYAFEFIYMTTNSIKTSEKKNIDLDCLNHYC